MIKTIPKKKKCKKAKWLAEEALQIAVNIKEAKRKGEKERYTHLNAEFQGKIYPFECRVPKNSKERLESLLQRSTQRNRGKQQNGKD